LLFLLDGLDEIDFGIWHWHSAFDVLMYVGGVDLLKIRPYCAGGSSGRFGGGLTGSQQLVA